ncbi:MAG: hypothetical protein U0M42_01345 [Acutalibacteraceae bacterium]|nr:hypothetical protein [Acutalibacteraceae bacterium]
MESFWGSDVWGTVNLVGSLLLSLIIANALKKGIKFLRVSLIPTSVLAGIILLTAAGIYDLATGKVLFETVAFNGVGYKNLEMITYHTLALGFIASTLKSTKNKFTKKRAVEIFNTGVTTVSTYLLQAIVGMAITLIAALFIKGFFSVAGILLPLGYGQGSGQALNYGNIYETEFGFEGGKSFGLTIAALGFLSASIGGVFHLNILKKKKIIKAYGNEEHSVNSDNIEGKNEIPMQGSIDKITVQVCFTFIAYLVTFLLMWLLGNILPGMRSVIFGFNFLIGVLSATLVKVILNLFKKKKIVEKEYINDFLMTRISNFFFDIMVVAGIAAIRLGILGKYWGIMTILGIVGLVITYLYNLFVAKVLFKEYTNEQFLMMYGMLTGTASTGTILLREIDGEFKTPAADNMVYQNFPAILLGFPIMLLATVAPAKPYLTLLLLSLFFIVMNMILFRNLIFKRRKK